MVKRSPSEISTSSMTLAPAPQGCLPGGAQLEQRGPAWRTKRECDEDWGPPEVPLRRKHGDRWPMPKGDLLLDVVILCWWANHGRSKDKERKIMVRERRMDVYDAVHLLKDELRVAGYFPADVWGSERPIRRQPRASVPLHQIQADQYRLVGSLLDSTCQQYPAAVLSRLPPGSPTQGQNNMAQGNEYLPSHSQQLNPAVYTPGLAPGLGMSFVPPVPHETYNLPATFTGFQQPHLQHPKAFRPVPQFQHSMPQHAEGLQEQPWQFNPAVKASAFPPVGPVQSNINTFEGAEGLPGQTSGSNFENMDQYSYDSLPSSKRRDSGYATGEDATPQHLEVLPAAANVDHAAALAASLAQLEGQISAITLPVHIAEDLQPQPGMDYELLDMAELDNLEAGMEQGFEDLAAHIDFAEALQPQIKHAEGLQAGSHISSAEEIPLLPDEFFPNELNINGASS